MTLILELSPALETRLRERSAREGRPETEIAINAVEQFLDSAQAPPKRKRSILEFRGVGKRSPVGRDAQEYINEMRDEWDQRP